MEGKKDKKKKRESAEKKPRNKLPPATPITEPALPLLLSTVCFAICLITLIIDKLISSVGKEPLAPVILQLVALAIPAYLAIMLTSQEKSAVRQMRGIGFRALRAEYVFFTLFSALFAASASLLLNLVFGGVYDMSQGITLLGTFTAGENEYSVSVPYLVLTYALIPAICEEFLFRGVIFSHLERVSFPFAALVTTVLYAMFGFTLGGIIPLLFTGLVSVFVLYTTGTLWACVIMHFLFNLYRLFLESNISAYFLSSQNNILLVVTVLSVLFLSAIFFFSESARIYRSRAEKIAENRQKSASKLAKIRSVGKELRSTFAYKPSLVFSLICLAIFVATVIINYILQ